MKATHPIVLVEYDSSDRNVNIVSSSRASSPFVCSFVASSYVTMSCVMYMAVCDSSANLVHLDMVSSLTPGSSRLPLLLSCDSVAPSVILRTLTR
ncbi:hypothetical protein MRB53_042084 [Persea americana]|nr:hypothetical protein MRB53_042084 [Persea americana]